MSQPCIGRTGFGDRRHFRQNKITQQLVGVANLSQDDDGAFRDKGILACQRVETRRPPKVVELLGSRKISLVASDIQLS
jgi:hypothetical protein